MDLLSLQCNQCGAPVEIASGINLVKCLHCGAQLVVRRTESSVFTDVAERLNETVDQLRSETEAFRLERQLSALDSQWQMKSKSFEVSGRDGRRFIPNKASALFGGMMTTVFGCIWIAITASMVPASRNFEPFAIFRSVFPGFGLLFIGFGIAFAFKAYKTAEQHERAFRRYQQQRSSLKKQISTATRDVEPE